jgi:hypothetical protein
MSRDISVTGSGKTMGGDPDRELAELRAMYPDFQITANRVPRGGRLETRFEAVRIAGTGDTVVVISSDPGEVREALADAALSP